MRGFLFKERKWVSSKEKGPKRKKTKKEGKSKKFYFSLKEKTKRAEDSSYFVFLNSRESI